MSELDDVLSLVQVLSGAAENMAKYDLAKQQQANAIEHERYIQRKKDVATEHRVNLQNRKEQANALYSANDSKLDGLVTEFEEYGVNVSNYIKLRDEHKTEAGQKLLTDSGVSIGKDLNVSYSIADDAVSTLDNIDTAISIQEEILSDLDAAMNLIHNVATVDIQRVKDVTGIKGIRDVKDIQKHLDKLGKVDVSSAIKNNEDVLDEIFFAKALQDNPWLAQAYTSEKMKKIMQSKDFTREDMLLAGSLDTPDAKDIKAQLKIDAVDANFKLRTGYDEIDRLETALRKDNTDLAYGIGGLKGDDKQFLTSDVAKSNQGIIEDQIVRLLKGATEGGLFAWGGKTEGNVLNAINAGLQGDKEDKKLAIKQLHEWLIPKKGDARTASGLRANLKTFNIKGKDVAIPGFHELDIDFAGWGSGEDKEEYLLKEHYLKSLLGQWQAFNERYPEFLKELEQVERALQ